MKPKLRKSNRNTCWLKPKLETIDDFIAFFSAIPDDDWCIGTVKDVYGRHCAIGHIQATMEDDGFPFTETERFKALTGLHMSAVNDNCLSIAQPTPKARILAALEAAKGRWV